MKGNLGLLNVGDKFRRVERHMIASFDGLGQRMKILQKNPGSGQILCQECEPRTVYGKDGPPTKILNWADQVEWE